ncbi:hypothetical protein ACLKA6_014065 [Drosophila palustris]
MQLFSFATILVLSLLALGHRPQQEEDEETLLFPFPFFFFFSHPVLSSALCDMIMCNSQSDQENNPHYSAQLSLPTSAFPTNHRVQLSLKELINPKGHQFPPS